MASFAKIKQEIDNIIDCVRSLSQSGKTKYKVSVFKVGMSPDDNWLVFGRGSDTDNAEVTKEQKCNFGSEMIDHLIDDLNKVTSDDSVAQVKVEVYNGKNVVVNTFKVNLKSMDKMPVPAPASSPSPIQEQPAIQGLGGIGGINDLLSAAFGGLSGVEQSGIGSIIQVRDQLVRNEYEKRDMQRDWEQRSLHEKLGAITVERDGLNRDVAALAAKVKALEAEIEKKEDKIYELEDQVEELEKMKPENSIAGVAMSGLLTGVANNLLMSHAGTIGKLFGVDKGAMLGMLQADAQESIPQPQQPQQPIEPCVVSGVDEDNSPRAEEKRNLAMLVDSFSDEEFAAFWKLVMAFDENRPAMIQAANNIQS